MIDYPQPPSRPTRHSRNLSSIDTQDHHSQPTDPLIHSPIQHEPILQRRQPSSTAESWRPHRLQRYASPLKEQSKQARGLVKPNSRKWLLLALQLLAGLWTIYNASMYFLAFTVYDTLQGEALSLGLGICAGLSIAFLSCAMVLATMYPCVNMRPSSQFMLPMRLAFHSLSSVLLLLPAVVNFIVVFLWRNSTDAELQFSHRCRVDIDIVWSVTSNLCSDRSPAWGSWLALSFFRLILTAAFMAFYHRLLHSHLQALYPPNKYVKSIQTRSKHLHDRSESYHSSLPPMAALSSEPFAVQQGTSSEAHQQVSQSTLTSTSKQSATQYSNTQYSSTQPSSFTRVPHSRSEDEYSGELRMEKVHEATGPVSAKGLMTFAPNTELEESRDGTSDQELSTFVDGFRSLVNQITRETDEALEFAQSDSASGNSAEALLPELPSEHSDGWHENEHESDMGDYNYANPLLGYNEHAQPYPAEESIRIVNGFMRRMPTIESMGSKEMGSSAAGSWKSWKSREHDMAAGSTYGSRPPTRNARISWVEGSEAGSRCNSLSAKAEMLVGMNIAGMSTGAAAVGELGEMIGTRTSGGEDETTKSSSTVSQSTGTSYFTATTGSKASNS